MAGGVWGMVFGGSLSCMDSHLLAWMGSNLDYHIMFDVGGRPRKTSKLHGAVPYREICNCYAKTICNRTSWLTSTSEHVVRTM